MFRKIVVVVLVLITLGWLARGHQFARRVTGTDTTPSTDVLDRITDELLKEDPNAAATVTRLRENKKIEKLAIASAIREAELRDGLPAVHSLLKPPSPTKSKFIPGEIRLAMLATDVSRFSVREDRQNFLYAHGSVLDVLERTGNTAATDAYLTDLEAAGQDPEVWRSAYDDALALVLFEVVKDEEARAYYAREKDQGWLEETLAQLACMVETEGDAPDATRDMLADVLRVAQTYHPYFKQSITEHKFDASVYFLFMEYGDLVQHAVKNHALPLNEILEVVFANQDFFEKKKAQSTVQLSALLTLIRNEKPSVWLAARQTALALRLNDDAPQHAEAILKEYQGDDIASLLYAGYESEIVYAADALVKFEDLGVYILSHYQDTPAFHKALVRPGIGSRLIPYVATFGDSGLDRLAENEAWLDKYFHPDGTPRDKEWWTQIPGGAALAVAKNIANGHPNEWSELGWSALDVADAVLLVASFGSSAAVTMSAKQGGKAVPRIVGRDQIKRQVMQAGRSRAAKVAGQGSRAIAKRETRSLLRQATGRSVRLVRAVRDPGTKVWRMAHAVQRLATPAERVLTAANDLYRTWKKVSPATRKIVYRSLLAVGLFVTVKNRTIPAIPAIGKKAGEFVRDVVGKTAAGISEGLEKAIEALVGHESGPFKRLFSWTVYILILVVLGGLTWSARPRLGRYRHA